MLRVGSTLILGGLFVMTISCTGEEKPTASPNGGGDVSISSSPGAKPAPPPEGDIASLVQGNNEFALGLYRRLSKEEGNLFFSPYSISNALAMTYAGARGETARQMANVLHFTLPEDRLHAAFGGLTDHLQDEGKNRPFQLHIANALWSQKSFPLMDSFLQLGKIRYRAGLQELDFGQTEQARKTINRWVAGQTKDKIEALLGPEDLSGQTFLVLTNAIYFKATWVMQFPESETKDAMFEVTPTHKVTVPMMHTQAQFKYFAAKDCQWLELPYRGDRLAMILILPQKGRMANLEMGLTATAIEEGIGKLTKHYGQVALPRFKFSASAKLGKKLMDMGMHLAFSPGADFSGMAAGGGLHINNVIHQAYLSVDEYGSEAAAATAVDMASSYSAPFSFTANRPFLLLIRDNETGSILFLGRVVQPVKS